MLRNRKNSYHGHNELSDWIREWKKRRKEERSEKMPFVTSKFEEDTWFEGGKMLKLQAVNRRSTK